MYAIILAAVLGLLGGGTLGYFLGRYQSQLVNEIRTLKEQGRQEPKPEPVKPTVVAGAYQPPKEVSTSTDKKHGAGLVETKTPELLDWENKQEIEKLSTL
jgi:uncharacterized protein YprB with RNaseH-like and TPR domain